MMLLANSGKALQRSPNGQEFGSRARFQAGGPAASDMTAEFANSILLCNSSPGIDMSAEVSCGLGLPEGAGKVDTTEANGMALRPRAGEHAKPWEAEVAPKRHGAPDFLLLTLSRDHQCPRRQALSSHPDHL